MYGEYELSSNLTASNEQAVNWLNEFLRVVRGELLYKLTEFSDRSAPQNKLDGTMGE